MKKAMLLLLAAVTLLGFVACPNPTVDPVDLTSDWTIKGSFNSWGEQNFTMDELDNTKLTLTIDNLYENTAYKFVLVAPGTGDVETRTYRSASDASLIIGTPATFVIKTSSGTDSDANFFTTVKSVKINVDVSTPTAPIVTVVEATTEAAITLTNTMLADSLRLSGGVWDIGWTETAGTFDGTNKVTWEVTGEAASGEFYINSRDGSLKVAEFASPATETGSTGPMTVLAGGFGDNAKINSIPMEGCVYTLTMTVDSTKSALAEKYSLEVTLKTLGTVAWPDPIDTTIVTTQMTDGTGGGNSWTAQLGGIFTAVSGDKLYVRVTWAVPDGGNNVYLLLDNGDIATGATTADLASDLTTGWGNLGFTTNTAGFNPDYIAWGWRGGTTYNSGGFKTLVSDGTTLTGTTDTNAACANGVDADAADIWFRIPLASLQLDATHNNLKAVVLYGKDVAGGGLHSAIPVAIDTAGYTDIVAVATATLTIP